MPTTVALLPGNAPGAGLLLLPSASFEAAVPWLRGFG